jgi:Bacterial Ig-like domain (group 2)
MSNAARRDAPPGRLVRYFVLGTLVMPFKWAARRGAVLFAEVAAGWLLAACAGSPTSTAAPSLVVGTPSAPTVVSLAVSGSAPLAGATTQFSLTATLSDGTTQSMTNAASWSSSDSSVASVSASGAVTGVAAGDADITATYQRISGKAQVTVVLNLTGAWTGTGADGLGPETFTWVLSQSGNALSGSVSMRPLSQTDGSCGSCHKVKDGSISGSVSGTAVTLRMSFALGGSQPTPTCLVIMDVSASGVTSTSLSSSYTGSDSCEPAVALGSIKMTR